MVRTVQYLVINLDHHILSHPGRRGLNEDSVFPQHVDSVGAKSFVVCDGVGGNQKGEVASSLVSKSVGQFLTQGGSITESDIRASISRAEQELSDYSEEYPECAGMATTVVGFHPTSEKSAYVFWVGDSRLYHIRNGETLFRTRDHSLVQLMVENGQLTEEEARQSRRKNVILQAISDGGKESTPDVHEIDNLLPGDHILLMSDGILEGCPEHFILSTLSSLPLREAVKTLRSQCEEKSNDNFSLIALEIKE